MNQLNCTVTLNICRQLFKKYVFFKFVKIRMSTVVQSVAYIRQLFGLYSLI